MDIYFDFISFLYSSILIMNKFQGQQMIHPCLEKFHMYKPEYLALKHLNWSEPATIQ